MKENSPRMRQARRLERKAGNKPAYARVLMVCEGSSTEPGYFEAIRQELRVPTVHWTVLPSALGTGPEKVVEYAERRARDEAGWDEVYCIFDRDRHEHYQEALTRAGALDETIRPKGASQPIRFRAIPSVPCFEVWFLFHYQSVSRELSGSEALHELQRHMPEYRKNLTDMYERTRANLGAAFDNAGKARERAARTGNQNPTTEVDRLVRRLFEIAEMRQR